MNKNDTRYITADKKIRDAFSKLLKIKPLDSVRTGEIIAASGVHKSTFYSHYRDKYDLLESIADDLVEILCPVFRNIFDKILVQQCSNEQMQSEYGELVDIIFTNEDMFRLIMSNSSGSIFAPLLTFEIEQMWQQLGLIPESKMYTDYLINAITYIATGTIEMWVRRGCIDTACDFIRLMEATGISIQKSYRMFVQ